jgi:hypothetical protein
MKRNKMVTHGYVTLESDTEFFLYCAQFSDEAPAEPSGICQKLGFGFDNVATVSDDVIWILITIECFLFRLILSSTRAY